MKTNDLGIDLIKNFEGIRLAPYPDPATKGPPYTIGVGATFYQDGRKVTMQDPPLTVQQATDLLKFHLEKFEKEVATLVKVALTSNQFSALVSFAFNCGTNNLKNSTLLKKLNQAKYSEAADEFLKWTKANGKELPGLVRRRKAERELFIQPDQSVSKTEIFKKEIFSSEPSEEDIKHIMKELEDNLLK